MLYGDGIHDDTLALQEMLDACGVVTIDRPGTYLTSKTLIIHSNTRLILSPGVKIFAAPRAQCALIENEHFAGGGRDENIEIVGGIWDGNCDETGIDPIWFCEHHLDGPYDPDWFRGKMMRFAHIDRIALMRLTVRNPVGYGVQIGDVYGFIVRDLFMDYNWHFCMQDGIHINGPACDGVIENITGTTNDDLVSLTTYDEPHAEITRGSIENVYIHNLSGHNAYSGIRLLSGEGFVMKGIHIDGLYGNFRHHAVVLGNHCKRPGPFWYDDLIIENVYACKSNTPLTEDCCTYWEKGADKNAFFSFGREFICGNLTMRNVHRHQEFSTESHLFAFHETVSIDRFLLDNVTQTCAEGVTAPIWRDKGAHFGKIIERDSITETIEK